MVTYIGIILDEHKIIRMTFKNSIIYGKIMVIFKDFEVMSLSVKFKIHFSG